MISVENLVRQAIPKSAAPLTAHETWTTKSPNKNFVVMIDRLISSIDDYEKATVCAASVVKRLPPSTVFLMCVFFACWNVLCWSVNDDLGASKIFIIKRAIELAKRWWKATNDKVL